MEYKDDVTEDEKEEERKMFHDGMTIEEHEELREEASLIVGVIFIPGLIMLYLCCRFCIPWVSDISTTNDKIY